MKEYILKNKDINTIKNSEGLKKLLLEKEVNLDKVNDKIQYEKDLEVLQIELLKLQNWIQKKKKRVVILFEGRDASGKGGAIKRFQKFLNPRSARIVALGKPTDIEKGQWYFRRHVKELPRPGEIVFFDRSWYNRAVVEPVMGFCTDDEYQQFIRQVTEFEHMLYEDGIDIIKFWFSISSEEQLKRFNSRQKDPLKKWKISPVDLESRTKWEEYSFYAREMFLKTHTEFCPWVIVKTNIKRVARLESIRYVLSLFDYEGKPKGDVFLYPDLSVLHRYHRSLYMTSTY
jgi:polyphosphate kinase 2